MSRSLVPVFIFLIFPFIANATQPTGRFPAAENMSVDTIETQGTFSVTGVIKGPSNENKSMSVGVPGLAVRVVSPSGSSDLVYTDVFGRYTINSLSNKNLLYLEVYWGNPKTGGKLIYRQKIMPKKNAELIDIDLAQKKQPSELTEKLSTSATTNIPVRHSSAVGAR